MSSTVGRLGCHALTAAKKPCGAPASANRLYCLMHDPDRRADADKARVLGGLRSHKQKPKSEPRTPDALSLLDLARVTSEAMRDTLTLENTVERSRAVAELVNVALCIRDRYERLR